MNMPVPTRGEMRRAGATQPCVMSTLMGYFSAGIVATTRSATCVDNRKILAIGVGDHDVASIRGDGDAVRIAIHQHWGRRNGWRERIGRDGHHADAMRAAIGDVERLAIGRAGDQRGM